MTTVHYSHTQFQCSLSPPLNGYNNRLTVHVCTIPNCSTVAFTEASVCSLSDVHECPGSV